MTMTNERYWVVGGEYEDLAFRRLKRGAGEMLGPFDDKRTAQDMWRWVSWRNSGRATARFSIASEPTVAHGV
jgi:hypothetical protein